MNRKLILGGLVLGGLMGALASCSVTQNNEGCAIESGGTYQAKYTLTATTGNCAFFQTYDLSGKVIKDSAGNLLAAEEIGVQQYGPANGTQTVQETPDLFALNGGTNAIGTLGPFQANYCQETGVSVAAVAVTDPNAGLTPLNPDAVDSSGGGDTCQNCAADTDCASGLCNLSSGATGFCDVALGTTCDQSDCATNGGTCATNVTDDGGSQDACGCAPATVNVTYAFSNIQFEQAYSILGKQFHGSLQYDQVPTTPFFGSECHATITIDAVQYHDNAGGTPGHLQGDHCELDSMGNTLDCDQHAGAFGFPASTGWMCMPMLDQGAFGAESYSDGGTVLVNADGSMGTIPGQRCVPATPVPIGAAND